ncbi:NAD(P)-dependent alcohol dehydrogenase [Aspergillus affinis]|uniref:NAD(P)-dependent alcohol dehydrogenase n=1 Tax=Aspergillus affinis TaxID=1070780 RepID=UPI0022FDBB4D|nr:alcohol dehydrogenase [Aspergillus affinis]KAI9038345.1 alcohol dehydrogenase [Aspergillus affinis]
MLLLEISIPTEATFVTMGGKLRETGRRRSIIYWLLHPRIQAAVSSLVLQISAIAGDVDGGANDQRPTRHRPIIFVLKLSKSAGFSLAQLKTNQVTELSSDSGASYELPTVALDDDFAIDMVMFFSELLAGLFYLTIPLRLFSISFLPYLVLSEGLVSYGPYKSGGWRLQNLTTRPLRGKEVLVEIVASGICQTDLHFAGADNGPGVHYPRVMGHEVRQSIKAAVGEYELTVGMQGAGYVRDFGQGVQVAKVNDPVILSFSACKSCEPCGRGNPAHCVRFNAINFVAEPDNLVFKEASSTRRHPDIYGQFFGQSSFSSWSIVREDSVINVSGMVETKEELQLLSPLGCGIQTGSGAIIHAAKAGVNDRVAIIGLGGVGLSAVMGARLVGCAQIIGIDQHQSRLELARELGATHVISTEGMSDLQATTEAVLKMTDHLGANITLDTTGVPALIAEGVKMTAFKGKCLQVGTAPDTATVTIPIHEFMVAGKQFIGVVEGDVQPQEYIPRLINWVKDGRLPLQKIVKFYQAADFDRAIRDMQSGFTIKPIILW